MTVGRKGLAVIRRGPAAAMETWPRRPDLVAAADVGSVGPAAVGRVSAVVAWLGLVVGGAASGEDLAASLWAGQATATLAGAASFLKASLRHSCSLHHARLLGGNP